MAAINDVELMVLLLACRRRRREQKRRKHNFWLQSMLQKRKQVDVHANLLADLRSKGDEANFASNRRHLKKDAVPSIFPNSPQNVDTDINTSESTLSADDRLAADNDNLASLQDSVTSMSSSNSTMTDFHPASSVINVLIESDQALSQDSVTSMPSSNLAKDDFHMSKSDVDSLIKNMIVRQGKHKSAAYLNTKAILDNEFCSFYDAENVKNGHILRIYLECKSCVAKTIDTLKNIVGNQLVINRRDLMALRSYYQRRGQLLHVRVYMEEFLHFCHRYFVSGQSCFLIKRSLSNVDDESHEQSTSESVAKKAKTIDDLNSSKINKTFVPVTEVFNSNDADRDSNPGTSSQCSESKNELPSENLKVSNKTGVASRNYIFSSPNVTSQVFLQENFDTISNGCVKKGHLLQLLTLNYFSIANTLIQAYKLFGDEFLLDKSDLTPMLFVYKIVQGKVINKTSNHSFILFCDEDFISATRRFKGQSCRISTTTSSEGKELTYGIVNVVNKYIIAKPMTAHTFLEDNFNAAPTDAVKKGHILHMFLKNDKCFENTLRNIWEKFGNEFHITMNDLLSLSYVFSTFNQNIETSLRCFVQFCDENFEPVEEKVQMTTPKALYAVDLDDEELKYALTSGTREYILPKSALTAQEFIENNFDVMSEVCVKKGHILFMFLKYNLSIRRTILAVSYKLGPLFKITKADVISLAYAFEIAYNYSSKFTLLGLIQFCEEGFVSTDEKYKAEILDDNNLDNFKKFRQQFAKDYLWKNYSSVHGCIKKGHVFKFLLQNERDVVKTCKDITEKFGHQFTICRQEVERLVSCLTAHLDHKSSAANFVNECRQDLVTSAFKGVLKNSVDDPDAKEDNCEEHAMDYELMQGNTQLPTVVPIARNIESAETLCNAQDKPKTTFKEDNVEAQNIEIEKVFKDSITESCTGNAATCPYSWFKGNELEVQFYTGLPNLSVLKAIFSLVSPKFANGEPYSKFTRLLMTLMLLRHNYSIEYLNRRLDIMPHHLPDIFRVCIDVMYDSMNFLVQWPERNDIVLTTPAMFLPNLPSSTVIVHCLEILVEAPLDSNAKRQTFSYSKWHHTIKVLIGITPQENVSFVSKGWGGATPFQHIFKHCDVLKDFQSDDHVIYECDGRVYDAEVGDVFSENRKVACDDVIAHFRKLSGLLRTRFAMLDKLVFPIEYTICDDDNLSLLEKVVVVCSALSNCCLQR